MDMSDMLDVIFCMFEDDMVPGWEQHTEMKSRIRSILYRELYDHEYKYVASSDEHPDSGPVYDGDAYNFNAEPTGMVKPYIPPTDPEEFMTFLGGPLG